MLHNGLFAHQSKINVMSARITIPAEFKAIDKFSQIVQKMTKGVRKFSQNSIAHIQRFDTKISKTFGKLSKISKLAIGVGLGTLFYQASDGIKTYEDNLASFRTIVSDLNDKEFSKFKIGIMNVAKDTNKGAGDVAMSFEKIAGLNSKFAETEKGLSLVSKASIVLSKASGDDLATSAENLVGIMNQFNLEALQSDRVINVLAAGQAVGAASITQTAESYKNFGAVASSANISLEQSVGLIQTLGKFSIFGAEAGTKLRGATLKLQKAGIGYASGQFNINDALFESSKILSKLSSERKKDAFLLKTFGAENITVGKILLENIGTFKEFTKGVTGTNEAHKAAAINSNTLTVKLQELKDSFINNVIGSTESAGALGVVKDVLGFVATNINTVVSVGAGLIGLFATMKALVWGAQAAMFAYNLVLGVQGALSGSAAVGIGSNTVALAAYKVVTWLATAATTAFGVALNVGLWPILAIAAAIGAVIAIFYYWDDITAWFGKKWKQFTSWIGNAWNNVVNWFKEFDFIGFFKGIGQSILKFLLTPMKLMLKLASNIPGKIGKMAAGALDKIKDLTGENEIKVTDAQKPLDSPETNQARSDESIRQAMMKGSLNINLRDPGKVIESTKSESIPIPIHLTRTQGAS